MSARSLLFFLMLSFTFAKIIHAQEAAPLNINLATVDDLMRLPGIGKTRAEAILKERAQKPFKRISDLMKIKGIGPKLYIKLKPLVCTDACTPATVTTEQTAGASKAPAHSELRSHGPSR